MRRLRVAVLTHPDLVPPDTLDGLADQEKEVIKREWDVAQGLQELGHEVRFLGVAEELLPIRRLVEDWQPHVVFNLLNEFQSLGAYQVHVTSYLELLRLPYTGCNPTGLLLSRNKAISKKILRYHRIPTPRFRVFRRGRSVRPLPAGAYPLIVKSSDEEASMGIAQASVVRSDDALRERVAFIHERIGSDALAEEYIEGRELTVGILGNERLQTFPVWEMRWTKLPEGSEPIATERAKFDLAYQRRVGIEIGPARDLPGGLADEIPRLARRVYRILELSGFARLDLRLAPDGRAFVLEANAAPDLAHDEDFAEAARAAGLPYPRLLQRILNLALRYRAPWTEV